MGEAVRGMASVRCPLTTALAPWQLEARLSPWSWPHGIRKHQLPLRALTWSLGWWGGSPFLVEKDRNSPCARPLCQQGQGRPSRVTSEW